MKNIKFLVLALLLVTAPAFAIDDPTFVNIIELRGDGAAQGTSPRVIKLVRHVLAGPNAVSVSSGDAVSYSLAAASDDGVSIAESTASGDGAFAGIACTTIQTADGTSTSFVDDVGRRNWGWIVVQGKADATVTAGGTNGNAAGDFFITSGDTGTITTMTANSAGTAQNSELRTVLRGVGGFFMDAADTTSTSVEVYVENL